MNEIRAAITTKCFIYLFFIFYFNFVFLRSFYISLRFANKFEIFQPIKFRRLYRNFFSPKFSSDKRRNEIAFLWACKIFGLSAFAICGPVRCVLARRNFSISISMRPLFVKLFLGRKCGYDPILWSESPNRNTQNTVEEWLARKDAIKRKSPIPFSHFLEEKKNAGWDRCFLFGFHPSFIDGCEDVFRSFGTEWREKFVQMGVEKLRLCDRLW